jgi:hypothetical protein
MNDPNPPRASRPGADAAPRPVSLLGRMVGGSLTVKSGCRAGARAFEETAKRK